MKGNAETFSNKLATGSKKNTINDRYSSHAPTPSASNFGTDYEKPLKSKSSQQLPEEPKTPVDYEIPEVETENVYEDPEKVMESTALDSSSTYEEMSPGEGVHDGEESAEENYSSVQ